MTAEKEANMNCARETTGTEAGRRILDQIPSAAADYHLIHLLSAHDVVRYISVSVVYARDRKRGKGLGSRSAEITMQKCE